MNRHDRVLLLALGIAVAACGPSEPSATPAPERPRASAADVAAEGGFLEVDPPAAEGALALQPVAAGDDVIATWIEPDGDGHRVRFALLSAATKRWQAPSTVTGSAQLLASAVDAPVAVRTASGAYFVAWLMRGREAHASSVHLAMSHEGSEWRPLGPLHDDDTETEHGHVSLFAEGDAARAVWLDGRAWVDGGPMSIRSARVRDDGTLENDAILDPRVCDCCQTAGVQTADGPLVAYRDRDETEVRDIAAVRHVSGAWTAPVTVHADRWTIRGCPVNGPQIAAEGRRVALAWYTEEDGARVRVAFSEDAGGHFGPPVDVDVAAPLGRVDVEWARDGAALVSWLGAGDDQNARIQLRRVALDGRVGSTMEVARLGAVSGAPRMARLGPDLVLAWTETGPPKRVRAIVIDLDRVSAPSADAPRREAPPPRPMSLGERAPEVTFENLEGAAVPLATLRGRPVVLSFFARWCEPCRDEYPLLSRIARRHGERVHVVGVSLDEAPAAAIAEYARTNGLNYRVLRDPHGVSGRQFAVPPIPATFVFDAGGVLRYRSVGGDNELTRELPEAVAAAVRDASRSRRPADSADAPLHEGEAHSTNTPEHGASGHRH